MRKITFLAAFLFLGFAACNNPAQTADDQTNTEATTSADSEQTDVQTPDMPAVPADAKVSFENLKDGQTVPTTFTVKMGVEGMTVEPAGEIHEGFGHHHILIDAGDHMDLGEVIPADDQHLHFGKGQTETELTLTPGEHTLTLQFADGAHRSYGSQMATSIKVNVK